MVGFSPIAWLIGIPWAESAIGGSLLGTKLVLNELVAFIQLAEVAPELSEHSIKVLTFALCGFANFGSLGILLGGLYILVPDRREETIRIAPKVDIERDAGNSNECLACVGYNVYLKDEISCLIFYTSLGNIFMHNPPRTTDFDAALCKVRHE